MKEDLNRLVGLRGSKPTFMKKDGSLSTAAGYCASLGSQRYPACLGCFLNAKCCSRNVSGCCSYCSAIGKAEMKSAWSSPSADVCSAPGSSVRLRY